MPPRQRSVRECCTQGAGLTAEPGLLKNVKVCGLESANRRRYLPEALRAALPLYENAKVNIDHPERPDQPRGLHARFGKLQGARLDEDGVRADLLYNPAHPMAETVKWWAESSPDCLGLSHVALGSGRDDAEGVYVVEKVLAVRSVDLVADPATTKGLYESIGRGAAISKREFAQALAEVRARRTAKRLSEGDFLAALNGERPRRAAMTDEQFLAAVTR